MRRRRKEEEGKKGGRGTIQLIPILVVIIFTSGSIIRKQKSAHQSIYERNETSCYGSDKCLQHI